jgi:hypothetical protein
MIARKLGVITGLKKNKRIKSETAQERDDETALKMGTDVKCSNGWLQQFKER